MTKDEKRMLIDELIYYADKVDGLKKYLDTSFTVCGSCERRQYRYWLQKQLDEQIAGVVMKLRRIVDTIENRHSNEDLGIGGK